MKVQSAGYQTNPNFGVNFINKQKWNKEILNTLENSELIKNIDEKYPDAFMNYSKHNLTKFDIANDEPSYLASLVIGLNKDKVTAYNINSHSSEGADKALHSYISDLSLADIEKRAEDKSDNLNYYVKIQPVKKQTIFSRFLSKIFNNI